MNIMSSCNKAMSGEVGAEQRDEYRRYLYGTVLVKRTRLRARNVESREWSLVAKRNIPSGAFIGFYTGSMDRNDCPPESFYALYMGASQPCIIPFQTEDRITPFERDRHPLANMNEPLQETHANCHFSVQDFSHAEVEGVESIQNHGNALFFRGLACFACCDIREGHQLTWHYGNAYEGNRIIKGYTAGFRCRKVIDDEVFIQNNSLSVLETLRRVPSYCVFPVISSTIKSNRFKVKRRRAVNSEGEESDSFSSGSMHEEAYRPRASVRRRAGA